MCQDIVVCSAPTPSTPGYSEISIPSRFKAKSEPQYAKSVLLQCSFNGLTSHTHATSDKHGGRSKDSSG